MSLERSASSSADQGSRIELIDILRGAAAFAVVLFHVRVPMWIGLRALWADSGYSAFDRATAWITLPFSLFGTTVMLFFVVSGFAIHYPFARPGAAVALRPYGWKRFCRIYPPYIAAVILTVAAELVVTMLSGVSGSSWSKVAATAAMVQNYSAPAGQMIGNPSLWSLPVEIELYLVYPLLFWIWRRVGTTRMLALVAVVSAGAAVAVWRGAEWPLGNFAKYWIIWVSGAVLAEQTRLGTLPAWRGWWGWLVIGGIVLAIAGRAADLPVGLEHFLWGGIYFLVVLWSLNHAAAFERLPRWLERTGLFLGRISYSLYLVHFPILLALGALWVSVFGGKPISVFVPLAASLVPIPIAYVMWRYVELPSQAWGRAASRPGPQPGPRVVAGPIVSR